jgi:opacity protein-like surface antigen
MRLQLILRVILAAFFISASMTGFSQSAPAARKGGIPLVAGAGLSAMNPDYDHGTMLGGTLWVSYVAPWVPKRLYGIGIEAEARDLNYHRSPSQPPNLREDTAGGGPIYYWMRYQRFHPYMKALGEFGNADYNSSASGLRYNTSRTLAVLGGGFEYQAFGNIWARADYEYQYWPSEFYSTNRPPQSAQPQGITVGATYHFSLR